MKNTFTKKAVTLETFVLLAVMAGFFGYIGSVMGVGMMFNTLMNTAHDLLLNTVLYIMAIAVLAGAMSALMSEFGVIALVNKLISPIMRPIYGLPGAAALGVVTTFLSDNPAIIPLANDEGFKKYFQDFELPSLCNLGTSFGMGLIVWTFMASQGDGEEFFRAASVGVLGAFIGSVVSVRLMRYLSAKHFHKTNTKTEDIDKDYLKCRTVREGSWAERTLSAILDGGMTGVQMGVDIIPGVLIICTMVMILTNSPGMVDGVPTYTGAAYEGVALLPKVGELLEPILTPLFGFTSPEAIAFPITSLGAVGAAMGMVPQMIQDGLIGAGDIAVFTALGMCWSGYLSTHIAMMDALDSRELTTKAIISHTIGGIVAGIAANYIFMFIS